MSLTEGFGGSLLVGLDVSKISANFQLRAICVQIQSGTHSQA